MDCHKIKCSIQYSSEASNLDFTSTGETAGQTKDKDKDEEFGKQHKESMEVNQPHIPLEPNWKK
jgi:hypothetical protein